MVLLPISSLFGFPVSDPKNKKVVIKTQFLRYSNSRSSHQGKVASFGGVAFFLSYVFVLFFAETLDTSHVSLTLLASITIMFFTGLLDDMASLAPKVKFFAQFIAVSFLMTEPDFRLLSLHGFMGFYEIPLFVSVAGSMVFLLGLINAFNLIDGIDGLTGITGIIVASFYSYMFYMLDYYYYLTISLTTIATLLAFLRFNFSRRRKIFMGDTGSLVIGLVLGLLTFKLLSLEMEPILLVLQPTAITVIFNKCFICPSFRYFTSDVSKGTQRCFHVQARQKSHSSYHRRFWSLTSKSIFFYWLTKFYCCLDHVFCNSNVQ